MQVLELVSVVYLSDNVHRLHSVWLQRRSYSDNFTLNEFES